MSLIKELLLLPIAPVRGTLWVAERISEAVEREHSSGGAAVEQLDQVEQAKERGEVDEKEAEERQDQIIDRQLMRAVETENGKGS